MSTTELAAPDSGPVAPGPALTTAQAASGHREDKARLSRWLLTAPALVTIGIFGVLPLIIIIIYSFLKAAPYGGVVPETAARAHAERLAPLIERVLGDARMELTDVDAVFYFPFDWTFIVRRTMRLVRPRLFIMMETEIWPNLLRECRRRGVKTMMINGRLSSRSYSRYKMIGPFFRRVLGDVDRFCVQSEESARRLVAFRIDEPLQARIEMLGERANEGSLSASEKSEYEALIDAADFVAILKLKARRHLEQIHQ